MTIKKLLIGSSMILKKINVPDNKLTLVTITLSIKNMKK